MAKSGRPVGGPPAHVSDPLANGRYALAQNRDLTGEERRQHLLAIYDSIVEEIGEVGTLDRMAVRLALDLYARSLESKDLIAGARSLAEFIRAMGRLKLLDAFRKAGRGPGRVLVARGRSLVPPPMRSNGQEQAGAVPAGEANEDSAA